MSHILLVEDEPELAAYIRRGLAEHGHEVELAATGLIGKAVAAPDPTFESVEWSRLRAALAARPTPPDFVVALDWREAAKIDQGLGGERPVVVLDRDPRGFAFAVEQRRLIGKNALIVARAGLMARDLARLAPYFRAMHRAAPIALGRGGRTEMQIETVWATDFTRLYPPPYGSR